MSGDRPSRQAIGRAHVLSRRFVSASLAWVTPGLDLFPVTTTPLVNLVIGQKILEYLLERFLDPGTPAVPVDRDDPDFRCETMGGTPIHPDIAFVAVAVAEFDRIVPNTKSRVIDMSVKARGFPDWMKRALLIEARARCGIRGCDASYHWLQVDHIHPHSKVGPTSLANGQILCDPDNKWKRDLVA